MHLSGLEPRPCSAGAGADDVCALRFAEGAEASVDVFGSDSEVVGGAGLELGQGAGHGEGQRLQHADLLPVLLRGAAAGVVLVEGVEVVAVHGRARLVGLGHAPGQHDPRLTGHQLQLRLLRGRGALRLWTQAWGDGHGGKRGQRDTGTSGRRGGGEISAR